MGLNRWCCHREDEEVHFEKDVAKRLQKKVQKPDAIYGLRMTSNIKGLFHDCSKRLADDAELQQQPSPLEQVVSSKGDPLLYPFLVVEAKSAHTGSDRNAINVQTAFPIRAFLEAQARLQRVADPEANDPEANNPEANNPEANGPTAKCPKARFAPLVWFFSHKGEDWRLSMAFIQKAEPEKNRIGDNKYVSHTRPRYFHA